MTLKEKDVDILFIVDNFIFIHSMKLSTFFGVGRKFVRVIG